MAARCRGAVRHWCVLRGTVGLRTPVCVRCGNPNPRPLSDSEWDRLIDWDQAYGIRNEHVQSALRDWSAK